MVGSKHGSGARVHNTKRLMYEGYENTRERYDGMRLAREGPKTFDRSFQGLHLPPAPDLSSAVGPVQLNSSPRELKRH